VAYHREPIAKKKTRSYLSPGGVDPNFQFIEDTAKKAKEIIKSLCDRGIRASRLHGVKIPGVSIKFGEERKPEAKAKAAASDNVHTSGSTGGAKTLFKVHLIEKVSSSPSYLLYIRGWYPLHFRFLRRFSTSEAGLLVKNWSLVQRNAGSQKKIVFLHLKRKNN